MCLISYHVWKTVLVLHPWIIGTRERCHFLQIFIVLITDRMNCTFRNSVFAGNGGECIVEDILTDHRPLMNNKTFNNILFLFEMMFT